MEIRRGHDLRAVGRRTVSQEPDAFAAREGPLHSCDRSKRSRSAARGAAGGNATLAEREAAGLKYAEAKGARSLADLRALPAAELLPPSGGRGGPALPNGPLRDGWVVPATDPADQVPLMVGFVADDIGIGGGLGPASKPSVANFENEAQRLYGDKSAAFLKLYPVTSDAEVAAVQRSAARDRARVSVDLWAAEQMKASKRVYTYYFDRVLPWPAHPEFGAFHTSEVPYVFQTIDKLDRPWEPADKTRVGHGLVLLDELRENR